MRAQDELNKLVGTSSGFIESQPKVVRRRIAYLEELQEDHDQLQEQYEEEMEALEKKYRDLQGVRPSGCFASAAVRSGPWGVLRREAQARVRIGPRQCRVSLEQG